jgi:hypothetical protein
VIGRAKHSDRSSDFRSGAWGHFEASPYRIQKVKATQGRPSLAA